MSTCSVRVELEAERPGERAVPCGGAVRGAAVIDVDEEVAADGVVLELEWFTHGRGNRAHGVATEQRLPGQTFQPGRPARLPFELTVPDGGPVTYRGNLLNVDWRVRARVDLPWKIDPRAEQDFVVVAGPRTTPFRTRPVGHTAMMTAGAAGCLSLFLAPFIVIGLGAVGSAFVEGSFFLFAFGVIFAGIPAAILGAIVARRIAQRAVGHAQVGLVPARVAPGNNVEVRVDLPRSLLGRIRRVTCKVIGEEVVISGSGTDATTHRHQLHHSALELAETITDSHVRYRGRIHVPAEAATTFAVDSNRVYWHAQLKADITGVPDPSWDEELEVDVVRPVAAD